MTVTDALPVYHHREHHSIWIDASPEAALAAARETRPEDVPLVSMLFRLRGLRSGRDAPIWASMQARGFELHDPETVTLIGRPWTPGGGGSRKPYGPGGSKGPRGPRPDRGPRGGDGPKGPKKGRP